MPAKTKTVLSLTALVALSSALAPLRPLPWGQLNFLHTTDTHGWLAGHLQEPQYSADWGDYVTFAHHLRERADADGSDLLVIDTGDRGEGNGLYDASTPKGKYTLDILAEQQIDIITAGNHELYKAQTTDLEYHKTRKSFRDSYIASNIDYVDPDTNESKPLGPRFRKFTTKNQRLRIVAFGFLFDFSLNSNHSIVQPVEDTVKEKWFQDAIRDRDVDLFIVAGHISPRIQPEFPVILKAIRDVQWDVPVQFFGGHSHIRDYVKLDDKAYALQSGRYMETIGFGSVSDIKTSTPRFARRYIDNNLASMKHHTGLDQTFPTERGRNLSAAIATVRQHLHLDEPFGCTPRTLWLNRAPYGSKQSVLTWLAEQVLTDTATNNSKSPQLVVSNSGAVRFNVFRGAFTIDTALVVSPFTSGFRQIENVPYASALQMVRLINNEGSIILDNDSLRALSPQQSPLRRNFLSSQPIEQTILDPLDESRTYGYTTSDDLGDDGDDTPHKRIVCYDMPNCISSEANIDKDDRPERVNVVYNEFMEPWLLLAFRFLGIKYGQQDINVAFDGKTLADVMTDWVTSNWNCDVNATEIDG